MNLFISVFLFLFPSLLLAYSSGPPTGVAGEPPNQSTCTDCHSSFQLNEGEGSVFLMGLPENGYELGETYRLEVAVADSNARRWGFEMTSINDDNEGVGNLEVVDDELTRVDDAGDKQYAFQIRAGTFAGSRMMASWEIDWTAPDEDAGAVSFYFVGNAANNNNANSGDYIYSSSESITALEIPEPDVFTLSLEEGWNFVSSPVAPDENTLSVLFADIIESETLIMIRDMDGNIFDPMDDIDEIGSWNALFAYEILMDEAGDILFSGMLSDSFMFQLEQDWNWLAYTRTDTTHPAEAFISLENNDQVMFWAKDAEHRFYVPEYGFNGLGMVTLGDGVKLHYSTNHMDSMNVFSWDEPQGGQQAPFEWTEPEHNHPNEFNRSTSMSLLITEWGQLEPEFGDEIVVFEAMDDQLMNHGSALGVGVISHEGSIPIIVWGKSGEDYDSLLTFMHYSVAGEVVDTFMLSAERLDGVDNPIRFAKDTFIPIRLTPTVVDAVPHKIESPDQIDLVSVYPNPFNSSAEVKFYLQESGRVTIQLMDLSGRLVQTINNDVYSSGEHRVGFNGSGLPNGMYLIEIVGDGVHHYNRVVLLK